jgi:hypothetical protein
VWFALKTIAVFVVGVIALVASIYQIEGGFPLPTIPDIHPRDTTDGSSLLLPFVVKNQSAFFPIKDARFLCRVDLILVADSRGNRANVRGLDIEAGTYDLPSGGTPINVPCDTSTLIKARPNGTLSVGDTDTMFEVGPICWTGNGVS